MRNSATIRAALAYAQANCPTCLLCPHKACWAAVWIPSPALAHLFDGWPNERQGFGYALCDECRHAADVRDQVETELIARHGRSQN